MTDNILSVITDNIFGVWFLIGAALVFFMQCGFAMVETGFTRAKNAGNIIMEKSYGFLYRLCNVYFNRLRLDVRRGLYSRTFRIA